MLGIEAAYLQLTMTLCCSMVVHPCPLTLHAWRSLIASVAFFTYAACLHIFPHSVWVTNAHSRASRHRPENVHELMQARKLGPWSSAIQLVEARAAAAAAREDKILEAARGELEAKDSVAWAPSRDVALGPRKACRVDPLFSLSLSLIVDYLEDVETLEGLPDAIKV